MAEGALCVKFRDLAISLLFSLALTACGGLPVFSQNGPDKKLHPKEWTGTYGSARGKVMTLAGDGTARMYNLSSDNSIEKDSWYFENGKLIVHSNSSGNDVFADTEARDDDILVFKTEDPDQEQNPFVKISDQTAELSGDEYLAMLDEIVFHVEGLPSRDTTGYTADSEAETVTFGGMEFRIPAYYERIQSDSEKSISYSVTDEAGVEILLGMTDLGTALSDEEFRREKYGLPDTYMKGLGAGELRILDARNCEVSGQQARILTYYADIAEYGPSHSCAAVINNSIGGRLIAVYIVESLDSLHDYIEDYDNAF